MKEISLKTSKVVAGVVFAASILLGASALPAQAASLSSSQVQAILSLLSSFGADQGTINNVSAALNGQATTAVASSASSYTFNTDLTIGSTGADVTALQNDLIAGGYLAAGLNTGYFGSLTAAGVSKWQAANGISATGYFGPLSRAKLNASSSMSSSTSMASTTTSTSNVASTGSIATNTGVEGILTVNLNSTPSSGENVYEGDSKDALIGIKLQAQLSPIDIQRVQVDLGNSTTFYTKFFSNLYLVSDTGQILAQAALNTNTVTKQTSGATNEYYLTFSGFNYTIPGDNSVHVLTVEGDLYSSIDSSLAGTEVPVTIDANGIRGVDGAGVDQYGPVNNSISNTVTIQKSLADSVQVQLSTDSSTPLATQAVASQGSNDNELDGQTALVFDLYSQKDWTQLDNLTVGFNGTVGSGSASATTAYLYAGSQQISSAAISYNGTGQYGTATFQNVDYQVSENTTQPFTVKVDIKNANSVSRTWYATISPTAVLAENSVGDTVSSAAGNLTGSAIGNNIVVTSAGPVFTLVGTPTIATQQSSSQNNTSTTTALSTFNIQIQAVGSPVYFGTQAASTTFGFDVYAGGVGGTIASSTYSGVTSWSVPSSGVVTTGLPGANVAFELQQNNTIQLPVTFQFQNRATTGAFIATNTYAVGLDSINWSLSGNDTKTTNFMSGQTNWRTSSVSLP